MRYGTLKTTVSFVCLVLGFLGAEAHADDSHSVPLEQKVQSFSVGLGATRVIYHPGSTGATVTVNNANDYPVLVQSTVTSENHKDDAPFIVTPPLFRLDAGQQSRLRLIMTGDAPMSDRENMYWLCATGIPPEQDDAWAKDGNDKKSAAALLDIKVKMSQCIKLLVRPNTLKGDPASAAGHLVWHRNGKLLTATNATPFFVNIDSLTIGGRTVGRPEYVPPLGARDFSVPAGATGDIVTWTALDDLGAVSRPFTATAK